MILPNEYKDKKGEFRKEYLLTKDGFILYMFNIQGHNDFKLILNIKPNKSQHKLYFKLNRPCVTTSNVGIVTRKKSRKKKNQKLLGEIEIKKQV